MTPNPSHEPNVLLRQFVESGSDDAFREIVDRFVDLVYSAAVRLLNGDRHLAEDITQRVFIDLARMARQLDPATRLGGWLHRHTCFLAQNTRRGELRRAARERQAVEMNELQDHSAANLARITPELDEAINALGTEDREAILLRFFEQRDFRAVGQILHSSEDAARKRVDRALDKLSSLLAQRGVGLSATALGTTLAAGAVSAAPASLAKAISAVALAGAATGGGSALATAQVLSMSKIKIGIATALLATGIAIPWVIHHRAQSGIDAIQRSLQQERELNAALQSEIDRLAKRKLPETATQRPSDDQYRELMRLRGEVGLLRREAAELRAEASGKTNAPSMLSGLKANPGMWKLIRDQQKAGLSMVYKNFADRAKLETNQVAVLNELLADHVMESIDQITTVIKDRRSAEESEQTFIQQEKATDQKMLELLGPEAFAVYQDYTKNLLGHITAQQFTATLPGDKDQKQDLSKQLYQVLQEESRQALANAGLPADYQLVPTLNFRNFAFETTAERNLQLLDGIYAQTHVRAAAFLTPEQLEKFQGFRTLAIDQNRMGLTINRRLMSPGSP